MRLVLLFPNACSCVRLELTYDHPRDFALLRVERWESERVTQYGGIEDLDADVAVEQGGDDGNDEEDGVAESLEIVAISCTGDTLKEKLGSIRCLRYQRSTNLGTSG